MRSSLSGARVVVASSVGGEKIEYFVPSALSTIDIRDIRREWRPLRHVATEASIAPFAGIVATRGRAMLSLKTVAATQSLLALDNMYFGKPLTAGTLRKMHSQLLGRKCNSDFRDSAVWVDGLRPSDAALIPCPASMVPGLLEDYFGFVRREDIPHWIRIAIGYYQLLTIHPFFDGNGRLSRFVALINAQRFLPRAQAVAVTAALALQRRAMREMLGQMRNGDVRIYLDHWSKLLTSCETAADTLSRIGHAAREQIVERMGVSETSRRFAKFFLDEPLFTEETFTFRLSLSRKLAQTRLQALLGSVVEACRGDNGKFHYGCPVAIGFWSRAMESFAASCADMFEA